VGSDDADLGLIAAEVWDPATGAWSSAGSLKTARRGHRASLLPQGKVLVVGGENNSGSLASVEIYEPATNAWKEAPPMSVPRYFPAITFSGSSLLVVGGRTNDDFTATTDFYDIATSTWSAGAPLSTGRYFHTATELNGTGGILITGGWNGDVAQSSAELY
jgi:N-acetylneuraminic acid mutarotase